jgi:type I restriction enzyme S subunit
MGDTILLGEICSLITKGSTPTSNDGGFSDSGINFIKSESLSYGGTIDRSKFAFIGETTHQKLRRSQVADRDILYSIAGANLGKCGIARADVLPANTNQAVAIIRVDQKRASPEFVSYALRNPTFVQMVLGGVAQSAQPNVNLAEIGRFKIPCWPLAYQRAIASILGALDDKIDLNRRMNETLEAMVRAIFMDKQEKCDWPESRLSDVCEIFDGPHATPKLVDAGPVFLGISNLSNGRLDLTTTKHILPQDFAKWTRRVTPTSGDVVFSYETRLGQASLIPKSLDCCLGRRMGLLRLITTKTSPTLLLQAYMAPSFQETIRQRTIHGSTVDRIPLIDLGNFPIRLPTGTDAATLTRMLEPLDAKIDANDRERKVLSELCDLLLPKLISGEIRVKDAEKIVQAVL